MKVDKRITVASCPDCEEDIKFASTPRLGQKVVCPYCEADLQVVSLKPLELSWDDEEVDDDWTDDEDDW